MNKLLLYFSDCAIHPDGRIDPFLSMELPAMFQSFSNVIVIGHQCRISANDAALSDRKNASAIQQIKSVVLVPFQKELWSEYHRLKANGQGGLKSLLRLCAFVKRGLLMHDLAKLALRSFSQEAVEHAFLYGCWMSFDGYAAALCKRNHPEAYFSVRGHAFDIDCERNALNPYLMKRMIAEQADGIFLISGVAKAQYMSYMTGIVDPNKVKILSFGSGGDAVEPRLDPPMLRDGVLRIISCAEILPIKQVNVLLDALQGCTDLRVEWTHVGGGEALDTLRSQAEQVSDGCEHLIIRFAGQLSQAQLDDLYRNHDFDLFINCSQKEGVPVSIMEAMRYSIPAIGPDVGGIPEIIDDQTGFRYAPPSDADALRKAIRRYAALNDEEKRSLRQSARQRWLDRYQNKALFPRLFTAIDIERKC